MNEQRLIAKKKAEALLEEYRLTTPVPVFELAQRMGLNWEAADADKISKVVLNNEPEARKNPEFASWDDVLAYYDIDNNLIYMAEGNQPITRMRFTMAHEIGHNQLHKDLGKNRFRSIVLKNDIYTMTQPEEAEANYFAGYLLMPDKAITKILPYSYLMPQNESYIIKEFAKLMAVSADSMRIRLQTFKEENKEIWEKYNMNMRLFI